MQVYKALGMHLDVSKDIQRAWLKPATKPIYEIAKRTRERWIRAGAPIFENVSKSFFGQHWYPSHLTASFTVVACCNIVFVSQAIVFGLHGAERSVT